MPRAERELVEWEPSGFPTVLSFDPGGTTGWCAITVHPDALTAPDIAILDNIVHWEQGQIEGAEPEQVDAILNMLEMFDGAAVLFESFQLRTLAAELSPVRLIATVSWAMTRLFDPPRTMFLQQPADKIGATDDRLRRWGFYRRDGNPHARDATRHAIVFLRRVKKQPALLAAAFPHMLLEVTGR